MTDWHGLEIDEALAQLDTDHESGLTQAEASCRLGEYGPNELAEEDRKSPWFILWEQLTGIMVIILIVAAVVSALLGEFLEAAAIVAIIILNAILGFTQEYRAEKAMAALKKLAVPTVKVRRGGHVEEISARELVPGDVILLEAGNSVPADARLVESNNLRVQESILTGESEPVEKSTEPVEGEHLPLGDRRNMVYMGTTVTYGRGVAVVTGTGMDTELGNIAGMIQSVDAGPTPLQRRLEQLGKGLAIGATAIVVLVFVLGLLRGEDPELLFLTAIGMAVAAVPEGLPAVVTVCLALGAQRMLKRNALIRRLPAVETLGSVTVICSDKTGTLTENRMTVTVLDVAGSQVDLTETLRRTGAILNPDEGPAPLVAEQSALALLLAGAALCNDAILEPLDDKKSRYRAIGDPTEGALVVAAAQMGLWKRFLEGDFPRVAEVPFDSERKRMTTVHAIPGPESPSPDYLRSLGNWPERIEGSSFVLFTKGAIDGLLDISNRVWSEGDVEPLDDDWRERILKANDQLAENGMRVLGVAFRLLDTLPEDGKLDESVERDLILVGMLGMIDPPRPEVKQAVQTCKTAGIRPVMITGDHPLTAQHIACELGISDRAQAVTGQQLSRMTEDDLANIVDETSVYARVSPEHKLNIVQVLQEKGQVVAMTGDGVNDAPALKKADIGVAMGITGTDVSKEAAEMILLDDNFATIVAAVQEGRVIYDNVRKFLRYTLTSNAGEIWVMLLGPFCGMPLALLPLQILWINLVTDGLPGLALAKEPGERDTMSRPPYSASETIFGRGMGVDVLWVGLLMGLVSLIMGYWAWSTGRDYWQTMVFTTLTLSQMGNVLATRSERDSIFKIGLLSNKSLLGAVLLTFVLQMAVVYIPFLQAIFKTVSMPVDALIVSLVLSTVVFWAVELSKWLRGRRQHRNISSKPDLSGAVQ